MSLRFSDFEIFEFLGFADFVIVGFLGSGFTGVEDFETFRFWFFWIFRFLDFGTFGILGCWFFLGSSSDPPIPEVGFFDFQLYSGGRLVDPAMRSRYLLRRLRSREASSDSRDGSRRRQLLNR